MKERDPIDFTAERNKRLGIHLLPTLLPLERPPIFRVTLVTMEQRANEGWDNVMCAGREYSLADQVDQIDTRLWERQLPE